MSSCSCMCLSQLQPFINVASAQHGTQSCDSASQLAVLFVRLTEDQLGQHAGRHCCAHDVLGVWNAL
jgi:hypothetical protein